MRFAEVGLGRWGCSFCSLRCWIGWLCYFAQHLLYFMFVVELGGTWHGILKSSWNRARHLERDPGTANLVSAIPWCPVFNHFSYTTKLHHISSPGGRHFFSVACEQAISRLVTKGGCYVTTFAICDQSSSNGTTVWCVWLVKLML